MSSPPEQWIALAIIALGLGVLALAGRLRLPRWAPLLAIASGVLLLAGSIGEPPTRLVVIADDDAPHLDEQLADLGARLATRQCLVLTRGDDVTDGARSWQPRCRRAPAPSAASVSGLLRAGLDEIENLPLLDRLVDELTRTRRQVVILPGESRLGARGGETIDVAPLARRARALDVAVDLPWSPTDETRLHPPSLQIRPLEQTLMRLKNEGVEQFSFELLLGNVSSPDDVRVSCVFAGSCVPDESAEDTCGTAAPRCMGGHCALSCSSDADCHAGTDSVGTCADGTCAIDPDFASPRVLAPRPAQASRVGSLVSLGVHRLSDFTSLPDTKGSAPARGWYPLTCRATWKQEGDSRSAEATSYLLATNDGWSVVWGSGGRFSPTGAKPLDDAARAAAREAVDSSVIASGSSLWYLGPIDEARALRSSEPLSELLQTPQVPLRLLLVHDASTAFWTRRCDELVGFVRGGGNLVVSGLPPKEAHCELPALAAGDDAGPYVDFQPEVTFVLDDSRIGRVLYAAASTPALEDPGDLAARQLQDGVEQVQLPILRRVAELLHWELAGDDLVPKGAPQGTAPYFTLHVTPSIAATRSAGQGLSADAMATASRIRARLAKVQPRDSRRLGAQDLYVVFAYDLKTSATPGGAIEALLGSGARVIIVPIGVDAGFRDAFSRGVSLGSILGDWHVPPDAPFAKEPRLHDRLWVATPSGVGPAWDGTAIDLRDAGQAGRVAYNLAERINRLYGLSAEPRMDVRTFHRFVDGTVDRRTTPNAAVHAQPLRVQRIVRNEKLEDDAALLFQRTAPEVVPGALAPMPLAYGAVLGQGHVMALGYSLVDGAGEVPLIHPFFAAPRLFDPQRMGDFGVALFGRFSLNTDRLASRPTERPRLMGLRVLDRRFVEIDISQRAANGVRLDTLFLTRKGACSAERLASETSPALSLVGVDLNEQRSTYMLSPLQRMALCGGNACKVSLCRRKVCHDGSPCDFQAGEADIFLESVNETAARPTEDFTLMQQLRWLQAHTGGSDAWPPVARSSGLGVVSRGLLLAAMTAFLLGAVVKRLRRWLGARAVRPARGSGDPTRGLLRGSAEALGLPAPSVPAGAFAGHRPLEPADSLRSVQRRGLLAATLLERGRLSTVPQVALRIETSPRSVLVLVDGGASMHVGGARPLPPKLLAARRVVMAIAEAARPLNAQVRLHAVATTTSTIETGGAETTIMGAEVDAFFAELSRAAPARSRAITLPDEPGISIILLSDFLGTDLAAIRADIERAQLEGSSVGVIVLCTSNDYGQTRMGRVSGTRTLADRSHLDTEHLKRIHEAHQDRVRVALADAIGGVAVVAAELPDTHLTALVVEGPIMELLR